MSKQKQLIKKDVLDELFIQSYFLACLNLALQDSKIYGGVKRSIYKVNTKNVD